jgi:hypothetical protein
MPNLAHTQALLFRTLKGKCRMLNPDGTITVRIKASGQVIDLVAAAAYPMINGGTAELLTPEIECAAVAPIAERAVGRAQAGPVKKSAFAKKRS